MAGNVRSGEGALIAALAAGASYVDAARQAGVHERTVRRRMDDPDFKRQVDEARAEILARAVARLTSASVKAVETLEELLTDDMAFARLSAARAILELGCRLREQTELAARIDALEQSMNGDRS